MRQARMPVTASLLTANRGSYVAKLLAHYGSWPLTLLRAVLVPFHVLSHSLPLRLDQTVVE